MEQLDQLWTSLLGLMSQLVTPTWNDLIQYIPLLLMGLAGLVAVFLAWYWQRNAAANRSRVPRRREPGRPPPDVHLPGPSPWPFIAPVGMVLVLFGLATADPETLSGGTLLLIGAGVAIAAIGALGWLWDADRELRAVEAGGHALLPARAGASVHAAPPTEPPEGVHLPGPSAWPFLAPIGMVFTLAGLIFGPALIIGGLVMAAIASIGWLIDAGREYRQVEAVGHATPATRDPEKAFPRALGPVYVAVAGLAIVITLLPWLLSLFPGTRTETTAGPQPTERPYLSATSSLAFDQTRLAVVAGKSFVLTFENLEKGVQHNVAIYDSRAKTEELFNGEWITGISTVEYQVPALPAGEYFFVCVLHPTTMTGTLISS